MKMGVESSEAVVITGISGRFPGCNSVDELKTKLLDGVNCVTDNPRWNHDFFGTPERMGTVQDFEYFDASFFGTNVREADQRDPRSRKLLEVVYEAIIDAGLSPEELRGSQTGVFLAATQSSLPPGFVNKSTSLMANIISFAFDFKGPSYCLDTGCSSCMFVLSQAFESIRSGLCDRAIVASAQSQFDVTEIIEFTNIQVLDPRGKCCTFSKDRNGYVKSEAVIAVLLQRIGESRRIYGTVIGAGTNCDGFKDEGQMHPSNEMQAILLKQIYLRYSINPDDIVYVETHGTGTVVGDKEELAAIDKFYFGNGRKEPLLIGAVKSNVGHTETTSGLLSLVKVLIAGFTGKIAGNLNYHEPAPELLGIQEGRLKVIDRNTPLPQGMIGINSIGMGGTNGHIVIKPFTLTRKWKHSINYFNPNCLVTASGRTESAVRHFLESTSAEASINPELLSLIDGVFSQPITNHKYRGYSLVTPKGVSVEIHRCSNVQRPVWFVFSGLGCEWPAMGRDLMALPTFSKTIKKCSKVLEPYGVDLEEVVQNGSAQSLQDLTNSLPAITAVTVGLCEVILEFGLKPDGIIGHSLGEIGCAFADGLITVEQAVLLSYARAFATQTSELIPGLMVSVGLPIEECQKILPEDIQIACDNSDRNVTISGPADSVRNFCKELTSRGVFNQFIDNTTIAFHSKYLEPCASKMLEFIKKVIPEPKLRTSRWLPASVAETEWDSFLGKYCSADYFLHNYLNQVQFRQLLKYIPEDALVIEIAPMGLFQSLLKRSLGNDVCVMNLSNRKSNNNYWYFLESLGKIYNSGGNLDLMKLHPGASFPVSISTPMLSHLIKWDHSFTWSIPRVLPKEVFGNKIIVDLNTDKWSYLCGHLINGRILCPASAMIEFVWKTVSELLQIPQNSLPIVFEDISLERASILTLKQESIYLINIFKSNGMFEVTSERGVRYIRGKVRVPQNSLQEFLDFSSLKEPASNKSQLEQQDIEKALRLRGYNYNDEFIGVIRIDLDYRQALLRWKDNWITFMDFAFQQVALEKEFGLLVPYKISKITIDPIEHQKFISLQKEVVLDYNRSLNALRAGGMEIVNVVGKRIKKRDQEMTPKYTKYQFVPEITEKNHEDSLNFALTVSLQIVYENCLENRSVKVGSLITDYNCIEVMKKAILPSHQTKTIFKNLDFNNSDELDEGFDLLAIPDLNQIPEKSMLQLISCSSFLFCHLTPNNESFIKLYELETVFRHNFKIESYVLLRQSTSLPKEYKIITASSTNFSWIEELKSAIEKLKNPDCRIYLINSDQYSAVTGFFNSAKQDFVTSNLRVFYLKDEIPEPFSVRSPFFSTQLKKDLTINIFADNSWGTFRHLPLHPIQDCLESNAKFLNIISGRHSGLNWVKNSPYNTSTENGEVSVHYATINTHDLHKLNESHLEDISLGIEYSGHNSFGRQVMGIVSSSALATFIKQIDVKLSWCVPYKWNLVEAATVPLAYSLSYYSLMMKNNLTSKDGILIHNGLNDLSSAAINLALHLKCNIFVTVTSDEQKNVLIEQFPSLNRKQIVTDVSSFGFNSNKIKFVFNSRSGDLIKSSTFVVAPRARFIETTQFEIEESLSRKLLTDYYFSTYTPDNLLEETDLNLDQLSKSIEELIRNGAVKPLKATIFDKTQIGSAIKQMQDGEISGKAVIKIKEKSSFFSKPDNRVLALNRVYFSPEKSYIIIGGLGGFGLEFINWMISRGATKIIINSRRDLHTGYQALCLQKWRKQGVIILVDVSDSTSLEGAEALINYAKNLGRLGGIFNSAMVLDDDLVTNQTAEKLQNVVEPKFNTMYNLDLLTRKLGLNLDYFVLISSMVASLGNRAQSNYGFANASAEAVCLRRNEDGLPGLALEWGPIGDVGFVSRFKSEVKFMGAIPQNIISCLDSLDGLLQQSGVVSSSTYDVDHKNDNDDNEDNAKKERDAFDVVIKILGMKNINMMDDSTTMLNLGIDSLTNFEIQQLLSRDFGVEFSDVQVRNLTLGQLKAIKLK